jgi:hypothetical protein
MQSFTRLALLAALASAASAACSFSTAGNVWNVQIFDQANCSKSGHYQEFHGTLDGDRCFNVASSLNDKVLSFVWTKQQSSTLGLRFYADAGCKNHIGMFAFTSTFTSTSISTSESELSRLLAVACLLTSLSQLPLEPWVSAKSRAARLQA